MITRLPLLIHNRRRLVHRIRRSHFTIPIPTNNRVWYRHHDPAYFGRVVRIRDWRLWGYGRGHAHALVQVVAAVSRGGAEEVRVLLALLLRGRAAAVVEAGDVAAGASCWVWMDSVLGGWVGGESVL